MFFADQVPQCAEEGAGLGWSECHLWLSSRFCSWRVEMVVLIRDRGVEIVIVWWRGDCVMVW
jgi:hypothetical protein